MKRAVFYGLIAVFLAVFLFGVWTLGNYGLDALESHCQFEALAMIKDNVSNNEEEEPQPTVHFTIPLIFREEQDTQPTVSGDVQQPSNPVDSTPTILPEYAQLYLNNTDMVGWIQIEGTDVNYPVMQTPDRVDYYLDKGFDREYSSRGCIYAREVCNVWSPSDNVTLYGHNMRDGSMFADLLNYMDRSYWLEHPYIIFNTLLERRTYEIIAVFSTTASVGEGFDYHHFVDAKSSAEFDDFVGTCMDLAFYDTGVDAQYGDKLLTLSTCEYTQVNGRLVVVAKLIEQE